MNLPRLKPVDPTKPRYELLDKSGYHSEWRGKPQIFKDLNSACEFAAKCFAARMQLPTLDLKYHLQWDIVLRDETYTRVYRAKDTDYYIVAHVI